MRGKRRRWGSLLLLCVLLAGCWDRREIEERSNVLAVGVDACHEADCKVLVSRQIAIPGRIPLGAGAEGGGDKGETVVVITTPGKDGPDSERRAQAELNRTINLGHSRVLVFSEEFARQGLGTYLDYVRRLPEARRLIWIAIADGRAEDVIRARPSLERVPALYLNDMFEDAVKTGRLSDTYLGVFVSRISNKGEETIAPIVRMIGRDHPAITGLAVFREDRMVGRLSPGEMVTFMELRGLRHAGELLEVGLPGGHQAYLSVFGRGSKYQVRWLRGHVDVAIKLTLESDLVQLSPILRGDDPAMLRTIEERAAKEVIRRSDALMAKLQTEYRADILGIGERVRAYLPDVWRTIPDWSAAFANARVHYEVTVNIRRTGMAKD